MNIYFVVVLRIILNSIHRRKRSGEKGKKMKGVKIKRTYIFCSDTSMIVRLSDNIASCSMVVASDTNTNFQSSKLFGQPICGYVSNEYIIQTNTIYFLFSIFYF